MSEPQFFYEVYVMIYFIIGASGTGKTTLFHELKRSYENSPLEIYSLPQITTRPMREGEENDQEYHFITRREFFREASCFSATSSFYNTNLATPDVFYALPSTITYYTNLAEIKHFMTASPALIEDFLLRHAREVLNNVHIIHLIANFDALAERIIARGDDVHEVRRRLEHDREEAMRLLALISDLKDENDGGYELSTRYPHRHEIDVGPPHKFEQTVRLARQIIEA